MATSSSDSTYKDKCRQKERLSKGQGSKALVRPSFLARKRPCSLAAPTSYNVQLKPEVCIQVIGVNMKCEVTIITALVAATSASVYDCWDAEKMARMSFKTTKGNCTKCRT